MIDPSMIGTLLHLPLLHEKTMLANHYQQESIGRKQIALCDILLHLIHRQHFEQYGLPQ